MKTHTSPSGRKAHASRPLSLALLMTIGLCSLSATTSAQSRWGWNGLPEDCTFGGQVSDVCQEFVLEYINPSLAEEQEQKSASSSPLKGLAPTVKLPGSLGAKSSAKESSKSKGPTVDSLMESRLEFCYTAAKEYERSDPKYRTINNASYALELAVSQETQPEYKNKYVDDCVRITSQQYGDQWTSTLGKTRKKVHFKQVWEQAGEAGVTSSVRDDLQRCFNAVTDEHPQWEGAETLLIAQLQGDASAKNTYVDECIRETSAVRGEGWITDIKVELYWQDMSRAAQEKSSATCKNDIRFSPVFMMLHKSTDKTVLASGVDPAGTTITVDCTGTIVRKTKDGQVSKVSAVTFAEQQAAEKAQCYAACEQKAVLNGTPKSLCSVECEK